MRKSGFTIIELMIASAILAIVMVFTMQIFTVNNRAYIKIDSVVDTQQSVRAISSLFERDLRHAGMMVPEGAAICGIDNTNAPDLLYISDHTAINPVDAIGTFDGARVLGGVTQVNFGVTTLGLDDLVIEPDTPDPSYDTDGNGVNDSDFNENGGGVIITDLADPDRGSVCGLVGNVNLGTKSITIDIKTASFDAAGSATLIAVPAIEYRIDSNKLYRNGLLLADGVEDLQLAFFLDSNGNFSLDVGELHGISGNNYVAKDSDASDLRAVRFNVVTRTRSEDERFTQGFFQNMENRDAIAGQDGYRRRVHTAIVRMRNIGDRVGGT
ncbi:MAG: prepilin-type N-terminal cleavage/methylation domain-containing protein [Deltaproteobacteria bacterium]|nr:prepilin-type N-terminal cleavage/methylation domain-containing protein [Deltaproteobacteria bacterium]MBW2693119.1 prepilin-type N-terminal cleavage/methylation domain-containing protein [Deltaproteobacteria bacterium]